MTNPTKQQLAGKIRKIIRFESDVDKYYLSSEQIDQIVDLFPSESQRERKLPKKLVGRKIGDKETEFDNGELKINEIIDYLNYLSYPTEQVRKAEEKAEDFAREENKQTMQIVNCPKHGSFISDKCPICAVDSSPIPMPESKEWEKRLDAYLKENYADLSIHDDWLPKDLKSFISSERTTLIKYIQENVDKRKYTFKDVDWGDGLISVENVEDETKTTEYCEGYNAAIDDFRTSLQDLIDEK